MNEKYNHPWLDTPEQDKGPNNLGHEVCDKCWQEKSLTGNCWCSDFGDGIYTKELK